MPRGPRKLIVHYASPALTHYGGAYLLHRFFSKIHLKREFAKSIRWTQRNNRYSTGEMLLAVLYPIILGLDRVETTQLLRHNGVFQYLTGLPSYPEATAIRRFLRRAAPAILAQLRAVHDAYITRMHRYPTAPRKLLFDLDSTILVAYGKQQGARVGYNPQRHGAAAYYPLLCFEGHTRDFWHGELQVAVGEDAGGAVALMKAARLKTPTNAQGAVIRADKGFYGHLLVNDLVAHKMQFVIAARLTSPIKRRLGSLTYTTHHPRLETAEFTYQPGNWSEAFRFVVVRREDEPDPTNQLTLFKQGKHRYQVLVTNLTAPVLDVWKFYNDRAGIELLIRHLKGDYAIGSIPTKDFAANEAYFHILLLGYNLINWFTRLCLPTAYQHATLETIRQNILAMPAEFHRVNNHPQIALPASGEREHAWRFALNAIDNLDF